MPSIVLAAAVFANIGVWFIEQIVEVQFEILSVSYIISELFLLSLHLIVQENSNLQERVSRLRAEAERMASKEEETSQYPESLFRHFQDGIFALTKTERMIFDCYLAGKSTKDIMEELNIKENTLKFHNKNIYGKLGVSSRKQLVEVHRVLEKNKT